MKCSPLTYAVLSIFCLIAFSQERPYSSQGFHKLTRTQCCLLSSIILSTEITKEEHRQEKRTGMGKWGYRYTSDLPLCTRLVRRTKNREMLLSTPLSLSRYQPLSKAKDCLQDI